MHKQASCFELLSFAATWGLGVCYSSKHCINAHVLVACWEGTKDHFKRITEGTYGKMFKPDTYAVEPEQGEQKRTLQYEVSILVELQW